MQDAMSVARNILKNPKLLPGGGATELTVSATLKQKSSSVEGVEKVLFCIVSCLCCIPSYRIRNAIVCIYINFWVAQCTGKDLFVFYQLCLNIWSFCFLFVSISGPMKLLLWHLKQFREHWPKIVVWMLLGQWLNSRERWLSLISCKLRVTFHLSIGLGLYGSAWLLTLVLHFRAIKRCEVNNFFVNF